MMVRIKQYLKGSIIKTDGVRGVNNKTGADGAIWFNEHIVNGWFIKRGYLGKAHSDGSKL